MEISAIVWYLPPAALPEVPLMSELTVGAWLVAALLLSAAGLLWEVARSRVVSKRATRHPRRPIGPRHPVPQES